MARKQRADCYKPYRGKRRSHIDPQTMRRIQDLKHEAPDEPLLKQRCRTGETVQEVDKRLGWLGLSHTARIIAGVS